MKKQQKQISLLTQKQSVSTAKQNQSFLHAANDNFYTKTNFNEKKLSKHYDDENNQPFKRKSHSCLHRKNKQRSLSQSKLNDLSQFYFQQDKIKSHTKNVHQQLIEDQYNLLTNQHKSSQHLKSKNCQFSIQNCKYIENYLLRIQNLLRAEKEKSKILKKKNFQLLKQNKVLNQYFQIFQPKYHELLVKADHSRAIDEIKEIKNKMKPKHSKSSGKFLMFDSIQSYSKKQQKSNHPFVQPTSVAVKGMGAKKQSHITIYSQRQKSKQTCQSQRYQDLFSTYG